MLKIGICDDERDMRFALRCKLERILEPRAVDCELYEFSAGDRLLDWNKKHAGVLDLIFLDIEMDGINGMETAKALRAVDKSVQMVFVTGHSNYVFDGYSVGALGYVMKPPSADQLDDILTRAMAALHMNAEEVYLCKNSEGAYRIPKASISYFSSEKRKVTCVAQTRSYIFYAKLDDVADDIGHGFVRIHQRYIVNASAVERITGNEVQIMNRKLPISRAYQKEAIRALTCALLD